MKKLDCITERIYGDLLIKMGEQEFISQSELIALLKRFDKIKKNNFLLDDCKNYEGNSCSYHYIKLDGKIYPRDNTYFNSGETCHDCNILNRRGNYHHFGCEMERCSRCEKQLISCDCHIEGIFKTKINSEKAPHYPLTNHQGYISIIDTNQINYEFGPGQ